MPWLLALQGSTPLRTGYSGGGGRGYDPSELGYPPTPGSPYIAYGMGAGRGRGAGPGAYWGPEAYGLPPGYAYPPAMPPTPAAAAAAAAAGAAYAYGQPMYPRGRGGFFPGGRNWAGARPPPPGQPGFSSGLQVVVHNLPWDCTWQQLKDAFQQCGEIERADVVFDSRGRSRWVQGGGRVGDGVACGGWGWLEGAALGVSLPASRGGRRWGWVGGVCGGQLCCG